MKKNQLKKINKFVCCLVILSLFLQFVPAQQPAKAETIVEKAGNWLKKLVTKVALPDVTLDEKGNLMVGSFNLADFGDVNPFSQFKLSVDGKQVKSQVSLVEPAKIDGLANPKAGELTIPNPYIPEICQLSIPLMEDLCQGGGEKCESKILAKNKACIALDRLQQAASQEVYSAYKIFNATDPFTDCLFVKNCRTNCSLRVGEVAFTVSLLDVAALFIPGGFLNVVQKILNIAKMINEAFKIYTAIKTALDSGVKFLNELFNVMGQLSTMFESFANLGLRWSDVLIYGGGTLASKYLGDKVGDFQVGPDVNGNIGWQDKLKNAALGGGEWALTAGDGLLGGVAASVVLNTGRVKQAVNGMQDMLGNFAQNNLKFSAAKTAAITANEKLKTSVDEIRTSFKAEPEFSFFFQTEGGDNPNEKKKKLTSILSDFQLFFRSVDEFLNDVKQASSLKDGRPVSDLVLGGGLEEWKNRVDINGDKFIMRVTCDQNAIELPLGGGLPATGDPNKYNCYVPDMARPINGKTTEGNSCSWIDLFKTYSANTFNLKEFFKLTEPDYIRKQIVGCDDLSCFEPGGCPGGPDDCNIATSEKDSSEMDCYGSDGRCKLNASNERWRQWWESLGRVLYGQKEWDRLWKDNICITDGSGKCTNGSMENVFRETREVVDDVLYASGFITNPILDISETLVAQNKGWEWTRGLINTRLVWFFDSIRQKSLSHDKYFLERLFPTIDGTTDALHVCVNSLATPDIEDKFWQDDYFYSNGWPYLFDCINTEDAACVEQEVKNSYEGDAAYEDWDEKIKIILANQINFKSVKEALELGVSPEEPIVVYKIAKANKVLDEIKTKAGTIENNKTWNDIANKIIDAIVYGTPAEGAPVGTDCSVLDCPLAPSANINDCLKDPQGRCRDCYTVSINTILGDGAGGSGDCVNGLFQNKLYPNENEYRNYDNCCTDEGNTEPGHTCCDLKQDCGKGYTDTFDFYNSEDYFNKCNNCETRCANLECTNCGGGGEGEGEGEDGSCVACPNALGGTSYCHPKCGQNCWANKDDCESDAQGKSISPVAVNIFDNLKQRLKNLTSSLIKIPQVFAATAKFCYPNCSAPNDQCDTHEGDCRTDYRNSCSCDKINDVDNSCYLENKYKEKYQCFQTHRDEFGPKYTIYKNGLDQISYFNSNRDSLSKAIESTAEALKAASNDLGKAFNTLQDDWNAPLEQFASENQESATARAQIEKILNLQTNSENIINNIIPSQVIPAINNANYNVGLLDGLISRSPEGVDVSVLKDIVKKFNDAIEILNVDVIDFAYTKIGPKNIGTNYRCGVGICSGSAPAGTFLCRLKCFEESNGRTFSQLITYTDILKNVENAAYGLTQAGENIKAIEPSMDMKPVTIKPNLFNEIDERGQCCILSCPKTNGNDCQFKKARLDVNGNSIIDPNDKEQIILDKFSCSSWTTQVCKGKTSLYVGQREGESNYQFFKKNLLANPLSTLEEKFNAVNAAISLLTDERDGMVAAFGDTVNGVKGTIDKSSSNFSSGAKDNNKGAKGDKTYKELSDAVLKNSRYLWWDLVWGNEDISQEILPACTTTEQILTNNPADIESQCKDRLNRQESINLLKDYNPNYQDLKDKCEILTSVDIDVLENLKSDPNYITEQIKAINAKRNNVGFVQPIVCPKWFCVNSTSSTWTSEDIFDPYCMLAKQKHKSGDNSEGAIRFVGDGESYTPHIVWDIITHPTAGDRIWPPDKINNWIGKQDICIATQGEIMGLKKLQDLVDNLNSNKDTLDNLTDRCNTLSYQEDFALDCRNFDILKAVWNGTLIGNYSSDQKKFDSDVTKAKEAIKGFCRAKADGKVITETIKSGVGNIGNFFGCDGLTVDLTDSAPQSQDAREVALKLCSQSTTDLRTPLNEIMKVFSVLLGVKSYTTASNGIGALYSDAQKVRQQAENVVNLIKAAPDKFAEIWSSQDAIKKIGKDNIKIKPVKCIAGPMISYAGNGKVLTGENGGQVCPNVGEQFNQLDASFSQVRQNLRVIDMARIQPTTAIGLGNIGIDIPDVNFIDKDLNEVVGPIYDRASEIKSKAQLLWALATAINYANENCTCGQSYCPMVGKIPLCISGLPLTLTPLKQPFCHLIWTLRYPLGSLAQKLKQELEKP